MVSQLNRVMSGHKADAFYLRKALRREATAWVVAESQGAYERWRWSTAKLQRLILGHFQRLRYADVISSWKTRISLLPMSQVPHRFACEELTESSLFQSRHTQRTYTQRSLPEALQELIRHGGAQQDRWMELDSQKRSIRIQSFAQNFSAIMGRKKKLGKECEQPSLKDSCGRINCRIHSELMSSGR